MTLNGVMALILRYFTEFSTSGAHCEKVIEDVAVKKFTFAICMMSFLLAFYIWGAHWRHLANTTEPSVWGGDAALCEITLTTCYY